MNIHVRNAYGYRPSSRETSPEVHHDHRTGIASTASTAVPRLPTVWAATAQPRRAARLDAAVADVWARPGSERAGQIVTKALTTDGVRPAEREAFWRHAMSGFRRVTIAKVGEGTFEGSIRSSRIGRLLVAKVRSTAQDIRRTPRDISPQEEEYFHVLLVASGDGRVSQDGRHAEFHPGD